MLTNLEILEEYYWVPCIIFFNIFLEVFVIINYFYYIIKVNYY